MRRVCIACIAVLSACSAIQSQSAQKKAHVGFLYPAGGASGTTFDVTVGGQRLKGATNAVVSGSGVEVKVLRHIKPLSNMDKAEIRESIRELNKARKESKKAVTKKPLMKPEDWPADLRDLDISKLSMEDVKTLRTMLYDPKRQVNPQIAERVLLRISIARDARTGPREVRLLSKAGLSNPIALHVDRFPECREREPNEDEPTCVDSLPAILNGQIMPGDVDKFRFRAKKGQKLVAAVRARALIPYLADAVPGWFQAVLALHDADGNELALVDDFRFDPDPLVRYEIPEDGEYELLIRDSIYRGREDFVYRIALGQLPFVDSIFPLGSRMGESPCVKLSGWNLPVKEAVLDLEKNGPGLYAVNVPGLGEGANRVACAVDTLEECMEHEPNNKYGSARMINLPVTINGRIDSPGDLDIFRFRGRKGEKIAAEVLARRLNSPVDSFLRLTNAEGKTIAVNDDWKDLAAGLTTHHADSRILADLPEDGMYYLHLGDTQVGGGDDYGYRLRVSPPMPDFSLRVMPSSISVHSGETVVLEIAVVREDGFKGDIKLELSDAPQGFVLDGDLIPAECDRVPVTLTAPRDFGLDPQPVVIVGTSIIGGKSVRRPAVPAEDMMQAFLWRHLVPAEQLILKRLPRRWKRPPMRRDTHSPVELVPGGSAQVSFRSAARRVEKSLELEVSKGPEGLVVKDVAPMAGGVDVLVEADSQKLKPGDRGNLILEAYVLRDIKDKNGELTGKKRRVSWGTIPAIPYKITNK